MGKVIVVTGGAGFIGSHLSRFLLQKGDTVLSIDCYTDYYDVGLKKRRINNLQTNFPDSFHFYELDLNEKDKVTEIILSNKPEIVIHLAAQPGVGYCEQNPEQAKRNNIEATKVLLEIVDREDVKINHFLFASSSSIYGCHQRPWSEELEPQPEGIYGNSKKLGEEMLKERIGKYFITSMRFFTVYGQGGRPDMAIQKFTELIHKGEVVPIFGDGSAVRDFTYVDDIVQGIVKAIENPREYEAYNFGKGSDNPSSVLEMVRALENALNKKANLDFQPIRAGDVPATQANISKAQRLLGYNPAFSLDDGIKLSVPYYLKYYPKYLVPVLRNADPISIRSLLSQSPLPSLIVINNNNQEVNPDLLQSIEQSGVPYLLSSFDSSTDHLYWRNGFDSVLQSFHSHSHFTPSTVFISFFSSSPPSSNFTTKVIDTISDNGSEVLSLYDGDNRSDFVRFDALRQFFGRSPSDSPSFLSDFDSFSQTAENNVRRCTI